MDNGQVFQGHPEGLACPPQIPGIRLILITSMRLPQTKKENRLFLKSILRAFYYPATLMHKTEDTLPASLTV
jgi:hypothetical protein